MTAIFDAREIFRALVEHGVEFVTIGGVAVQAHGGQRLTRDLDVAVAMSSENMQALAAAAEDLDARILGPDGQRSRHTPGPLLLGSSDQWHLTTSHGLLDVITLPAHLGSFDEMQKRAHRVAVDNFAVLVARASGWMAPGESSGAPASSAYRDRSIDWTVDEPVRSAGD